MDESDMNYGETSTVVRYCNILGTYSLSTYFEKKGERRKETRKEMKR